MCIPTMTWLGPQPSCIQSTSVPHCVFSLVLDALAAGSLGVYFLNLNDERGVLVFKEGTRETPADVFCGQLFHAAGVSCPQMAVLSKADHSNLLSSLKDTLFSTQGGGDHLQGDRARGAGGVVMEFQPGFTLKDARARECIRCVCVKALVSE